MLHQLQQQQQPVLDPQQQSQQSMKPVQKRTKAACVHCQAAKVACSSMRPCVWCIRHGLQDTCVDAPKKERKRKSPDQPEEIQTVDINTVNLTPTTNTSLLNTINFNTIPQYSFTPDFELPQFGQAALSIFEDIDDFSIESMLSGAAVLNPSSPPTPPSVSTVPNIDVPPQISNTIYNPEPLPPSPSILLAPSPTDASTDDFSTIVMAEIKRAQASMENVALLSQIQTAPNLLPSATIKVPELLFTECNEAFARLMEYNTAQDLVNAQITMLDLVFPQLRALLQRRAHKFMHKHEAKLVRTALLQTRLGTAKCCTLVLKPNGIYCKLYILRSATGVPERAARKLECITALNMAKQKRCSIDQS